MPPSAPVIAIIEDEASIAETIVYALKTEGFDPRWVTTGAEGLRIVGSLDVALVILDLGLPDISGFDVCREIRRSSSVPVLFLTARAGEIDRIVGLELGADDYVTKPFSPRELTARVRAILRRTQNGVGSAATAASKGQSKSGVGAPRPQQPAAHAATVWHHDAARCRISFHGQPLELTRNEYRLLAALLASPGRVFNRDQIMAAAWDDPGAAMDRTVDAHVKSVRAKLREIAPDADPIVTHRGLGYALREEP